MDDDSIATRISEAGPSGISGPATQRPVACLQICHSILYMAAVLVAVLFISSLLSASECIPIHEAGQHIGETRCVTGKVLHVKVGAKGVHFLDFCEDAMACPFTVVVFAGDLKDVGDVRRLVGRTIEVRGNVKAYDGRPEIILRRISQIEGGAAMIPPLPKNYDVENRGHFSAGRLYPSKKPKKNKAKPNSTATFGDDVEGTNAP
jgi:hypothetical protein